MFIIYACLAVLSIALLSGTVGVFINIKGLDSFSDSIVHGVFAALAVSAVIGASNNITLILSIVCALIMGLIFSLFFAKLKANDASVVIVYTFLFAIGIIIISLSKTTGNAENLLFGNLFALTFQKSLTTFIITIFLLSIFAAIYKKLMLAFFSEKITKSLKISYNKLIFLFNCVISISAVIVSYLSGTLIAPILFLMPVIIARLFAKNVISIIISSFIISFLFGIIGLWLSYYISFEKMINITPGVLISCLISGLYILIIAIILVKKILQRCLKC